MSFENKKQEIIEQKQKVLEECKALYDWAKEQKMSDGDAYEFVLGQMEEIEKYWSLYCWGGMNGHIQKAIPLDTLETHSNWSDMTQAERDTLLFNLGMDTPECSTMTMTRLVGIKGKKVLKEVVVGMERVDEGWVEMRHSDGSFYCSDEARDRYSAVRYGCSLRELCNNNISLCTGSELSGGTGS